MSNKNKQETRRDRKAFNKDFFVAIKEDFKRNGLMKSEKAGNRLIDLIGKITITVFFVSFLISVIVILTHRPSSPPDIYDMLGVDTAEYMQSVLPSDKKIFDSDKPVPEQLSQILLSDDVRVYKNNSLKFTMSENRVDQEELPELSEKIKNAQETEAETEEDEAITYYLILFDDRRMVNFSLSETALEINGKKYKI